MNVHQPKKVLVVPMDWGLGHATRCIPIINELLKKKCEVILAGEGKIETLLKSEFPQLTFLQLRGYNVEYSHHAFLLKLKIIKQIPKLLSIIHYENEWLKQVVKEHSIDAVISDNRFGLFHPNIHSVFITHQLRIKSSFIIEGLLQKINYSFINRFNECWVPDNKSEENLGGQLSHPGILPRVPTHYIGPLSRFANVTAASVGKHVLIILSGPEPQRTLFEDEVMNQLENYNEPVVLVRGLPEEKPHSLNTERISIFNHLSANELRQLIIDSKYVISRCGYSTVMDIAALKKESILIPTPGQTEQEYLSTHLNSNKIAFCIQQNKFKLSQALDLANSFDYRINQFQGEQNLSQIVDEFMFHLQDSNAVL